jgi:type II secretory pathway component PulJ
MPLDTPRKRLLRATLRTQSGWSEIADVATDWVNVASRHEVPAQTWTPAGAASWKYLSAAMIAAC